MGTTPTISSQPCRSLLKCAVAHGVDERELCELAGLGVQTVKAPEGQIPLPSYYGLLEGLADLAGDPYIGLKIPQFVDSSDYGLLGFLFFRSMDIGQAFERVIRFHRLVGDSTLSMEVENGRGGIHYELWGPRRCAHELVADVFAAEMSMAFQTLCGDSSLLALELKFPSKPKDISAYETQLGLTPTFNASKLAVCFDAVVLSLPIEKADPELADVLERQAEKMLSLLPRLSANSPVQPHHDRVREELLDLLPDGVPRIELVAKRMGQSSRSLQRRLQGEGTSLKQIVDELRQQLSQEHLKNGRTTGEVALLLGFSEVSGFSRAFRRWTGLSPSKWRGGE